MTRVTRNSDSFILTGPIKRRCNRRAASSCGRACRIGAHRRAPLPRVCSLTHRAGHHRRNGSPMESFRGRFWSVSGLLALVGILSGWARFPQNLGIRPNEPTVQIDANACEEYRSYSSYAQALQEAYHSRASQNRGWLYVAGILGLGVAAASGGLAVAGVAAGTLGLLAISGGFAAG